LEKKMRAKQLIATVAMIAATGSVFAQQGEWIDPTTGYKSTKTRAEVKAELKQAEENGTYVVGGAETPELQRQLAHQSQAGAEVAHRLASRSGAAQPEAH
jgi:Domain of unknown function (DUF4148)